MSNSRSPNCSGCSSEKKTAGGIAKALQVSGNQIRVCLKRMVEEGRIEKLSGRPAVYRSSRSTGPLFDRQD